MNCVENEMEKKKKWFCFIVFVQFEINYTSRIIDNEKLRGSNLFDKWSLWKFSNRVQCTTGNLCIPNINAMKGKKKITLTNNEPDETGKKSERSDASRPKLRAKYLFMQIVSTTIFFERSNFMSNEQHTFDDRATVNYGMKCTVSQMAHTSKFRHRFYIVQLFTFFLYTHTYIHYVICCVSKWKRRKMKNGIQY